MNDFRRLEVWKEAMSLAGLIYAMTSPFPESERFGLQAQMRRASVSVASNIAEGAGRNSPKDFARFVEMASGSAAELETQLLIAVDVGLLDPADAIPIVSALPRLRGRLERLRHRLTAD